MRKWRICRAVCASLLAAAAQAASGEIRLVVRSGTSRCIDAPVSVAVPLPKGLGGVRAEELAASLRETARPTVAIAGQVLSVKDGKAELWWVVPELVAGAAQEWTVSLSRARTPSRDGFSWTEKPLEHLELSFGGRPVVRYMCARDSSTSERAEATYKPYLHVSDEQGKGFITKGPGGLYTHHRGLFIGWNKVGFGAETYDLWHMKGVLQVHRGFGAACAGPVLARFVSHVDWLDPKGEPVISEERMVTAYRASSGRTLALLDFESRLAAPRGDVVLDGDPEHAGFHFRAHDAVDKKATKYLFHRDGIDPRKDRDLPWVAMGFELEGASYSVQIMDAGTNPRPTTWSAYRDYGRFGVFFKKTIKSGETLVLRHRVWAGSVELPSREELAARASAFAEPPRAEVLAK